MKNISNKIVWITGASSGIGAALAESFAREGARLILTARNLEKLKAVREKCLNYTSECDIYAADLSLSSDIEQVVKKVNEKHNVIDVLVNNAGMSQRSLAKDTSIDIDRKLMELNFFGAVYLTKLVLPGMLNNQSGHIVAVSSIVGKFGFPLRSAYSASKHAIQGFYESLRAELAFDNINVTIVSPGRIKTEISKNALTEKGVKHGEMDPGQANGMDADACAQKIIKAIKSDKKDVLVGGKELMMVHIYKYLPALYNKMVNKINSK